MKQISQGAEAKLYSDGKKVIKHRFSKSYRHPELDKKIRQFRTRREAKVLERLHPNSPLLIKSCDKEMKIEMEHLKGKKVKDVLEKNKKIALEIGKNIAKMHSQNIIHGDLTTSNMIFHKGKVRFIDYGLSFFSDKDEDKAVDLHLMKRALESAHYKVYSDVLKYALKGYSIYPEHKKILERLEKVEKRGRHKNKH